jgi:hypothetical protein
MGNEWILQGQAKILFCDGVGFLIIDWMIFLN